jgi:hypothetical protein
MSSRENSAEQISQTNGCKPRIARKTVKFRNRWGGHAAPRNKPKSDDQADKIEKLIRVLVTTMSCVRLRAFENINPGNNRDVISIKSQFHAPVGVKHIGFRQFYLVQTCGAVFREEEVLQSPDTAIASAWDAHSHGRCYTIFSSTWFRGRVLRWKLSLLHNDVANTLKYITKTIENSTFSFEVK